MGAAWYPANSVEREMAWALSGGNYARYFRAFLTAGIHLPWRYDEADPDDWRPVTREVADGTVLPVFTSDASVAAGLHETADGYVVITFDQLARLWPDPGWGLAIDPGLPIEAYLPVRAVEPAARGELSPRQDPELVVRPLPEDAWEPWPPGGPHEALFDAVAQGDGVEYLDALISCTVTVPTARTVSDAELRGYREASLYNPGLGPLDDTTRQRLVRAGAPAETVERPFPWRPGGTGAEPVVEVFTRTDLFGQAHPDTPSVRTGFTTLLELLPDGYALSVNPDGPAGLDLSAELVPMLRAWSRTQPVPYPLLRAMRWARDAEAEPR